MTRRRDGDNEEGRSKGQDKVKTEKKSLKLQCMGRRKYSMMEKICD
jgi:hypothetical protein